MLALAMAGKDQSVVAKEITSPELAAIESSSTTAATPSNTSSNPA